MNLYISLLYLQVIFNFSNQIDEELKDQLTEMQIIVKFNGNGELQTDNDEITKLNLDVTTLMAFVSNMTCEACNITLSHKILNDQAQRERLVSTKAVLDQLFKGCRRINKDNNIAVTDK